MQTVCRGGTCLAARQPVEEPVEDRNRWKALQSEVAGARAAFSSGDRDKAIAHLDAALAIDPSFLAAQSLRERILAPHEEPVRPAPRSVTRESQETVEAGRQSDRQKEAHAQLEQHAKARRIDLCVAKARVALGRQQLSEAVDALDELVELDPDECNLASLSAELADLRRRATRRPFGARLAAAVVFVSVAGSASWLQESRALTPFVVVTTSMPRLADSGDAGNFEDARVITGTPVKLTNTNPGEPVAARNPVRTAERNIVAPSPRPAIDNEPSVLPPPATVVVPQDPPAATAAMVVPVVATMAVQKAGDNELVYQTLQRYRGAYAQLSAQSAQAVYPTVNRDALARAFDGLESQSLTFDACDVVLRGASAVATCRGSTRYVPKIGSREARTERRIWNFILHKDDGDWTIENAKAAR
jgi:tetratricopeptide (TPR) repeat protein